MTKFTVSFLRHFRNLFWKSYSRWIFSAVFTVLLLVIFIFLPVWDKPQNPSGDNIEISTEKVSLVKIIAKAPPKKVARQNQEKKPAPKKENAIASPDAKVVEEEKDSVPLQEEITEIPDDLPQDDYPDDVPRAETFDENAIYDPTAAHDVEGDSKEGSEKIAKAQETYKQYVKKRIAAKKVYPMKARAQGQTGNVKVHLVVASDGTLQSAQITSPSEFELLNEAALAAVKKSAPFKKMPAGLDAQEFTFTLEFKLE